MTDDGSSKFKPVPVRPATSSDNPSVGKVMIGSLDDSSLFVEAQFNPKELEVTRTVPWDKTNEANRSNARGRQNNQSDAQGIHLEFKGAEGRAVSLELLFDGYEGAVDVAQCVKKLQDLASVRQAGATKEDLKRPHRCVVVWGNVLPSFKCVIDSLSTKYTMFDKDGKPLRATCTVKLKEADVVSVAKKK